jgi:pimeloyl-ACP methyl ester carboxylesterase
VLQTTLNPKSESLWVELPQGLRLHARSWGTGQPTCLLIHGFGEGSYVWTPLAASLLPFGRVVALDLRGHGDSEWDPAHEYATSTHLSDVMHAINTLAIEQFIVVGHSMGGEIALQLTSRMPARARALAIVDYAPHFDVGAHGQAMDLFREGARPYATLDDYVSFLESTRPLGSREQSLWLAGECLRRDPAGTLRLKCDPVLPDCLRMTQPSAALLETITCPVLVVRGACSALVSQPTAQSLARTFALGELAVVRRAGHAVMLDNPPGFRNAIVPFIARVATHLAGSAAPVTRSVTGK